MRRCRPGLATDWVRKKKQGKGRVEAPGGRSRSRAAAEPDDVVGPETWGVCSVFQGGQRTHCSSRYTPKHLANQQKEVLTKCTKWKRQIKNQWDPKISSLNESFGRCSGLPNLWDHPFVTTCQSSKDPPLEIIWPGLHCSDGETEWPGEMAPP